MRLTLRTLLAYTDDILEPADHEELGKKIEASDFATELIHRSRDTVRRLRLGAPDVLAGEGDGDEDVLDSISVADANAVAEYLDNTLPAGDVADFERICLEPGNEADMHLAEVASCHHVLTMVLGEAAEIDMDVRRRMYELPEKLARGQKLRIEPGHAAPPQSAPVQAPPPKAPTPVAAPPAAAQVEVVTSELPDYLRAAAVQRRRGKRWAIIAALLAVAGGIVGFFVSAEFVETKVPAGLLAQGELELSTGELTIEGAGDPESGAQAASEGQSDVKVVPLVPERDSEAPAFTEPAPVPTPKDTVGADQSPLDLDTKFPEVAPKTTDDDPKSPAKMAVKPSPAAPDDLSGIFLGDDAKDDDAKTAVPGGEEKAPGVVTTEEEPDREVAAIDEESPSTEGPVQLGNYSGNNDVLLRYDLSGDKWVRLPPRSAVSSGDSLLALPRYRPHVVLADVNAYLSGGTRVDLPLAKSGVGDERADLELSIVYGRMLLNAGLKGSHVALHVGEEVRHLRLGGSASLAIEVRRVFIPGSNNEQESSPVEATWYLTSGEIDWPAAVGDSLSIQAPATWNTVDGIDGLPQPFKQLPEWIDREPLTDLQRRARDTLAEELAPGEPVGLRLLELNDKRERGRRSEVRTLAAASSAYVGEFEPFVKALSDKDQRRAWETHIQTLRQALALSPDIAAKVRKAFVGLRGEQAAGDLMEMVAGYNREAIGETREAVQEGAIAKLIRRLESDSLDYRVLAIYNLNEIYGTTSLKGFRPDDSSTRRKVALAKIRESLQANELVPKP